MTDDLPADILQLFDELNSREVHYMVVGMSSAIMQGVPATTQDIDLWFERYSDPGVTEAVRAVGGVFAWRASPPIITGTKILDTVDVVSKCSGIGTFREEYQDVIVLEHIPTGIRIPVLPVERVLASKKAAGRPKDHLAVRVIEDSLHVIRKKR
jgi:hypothetical protein